ncbi:MAG: hypothetical protein CMO55_11435 [Verrucomicrobiales bacterium]|nr:hypothetical protein [Verrucomicrobiales bacterium]
MPSLEPSPGAVTEFFRLQLASKFRVERDVEAWATAQIEIDPSPSYELCELATATTIEPPLLFDALRDFPKTEDDHDLAWAMFCRYLYSDLTTDRCSVEETVYALYRLDRIHELPEHLNVPVSILEDQYSLVRDSIYGTLDEVKTEATRLLQLCFDDETPDGPKV